MVKHFVTAILRILDEKHCVLSVLLSLIRQPTVKQIIVVNDNQNITYSLDKLGIEEKELFNTKIIFVNFTSKIGERAFIVAGQLAEQELCFLWETESYPPSNFGFIEDLCCFYERDKLVGLLGQRLEGVVDWLSSTQLYKVENETPVDYLDPCGMVLHRQFLQLPDTDFSERYSQHIGIWICANAKFNMGASLSVVPINTFILEKQQKQIKKLNPLHNINELQLDFAIAYLNHNRLYRDWTEINVSILPSIKAGSHFEVLPPAPYTNLLVFGCQRSGTTWISKCIGEYFPSAFSFTEEQTFHFLLNGYILPKIQAQYLVFQTTFINTEVESYYNAPINTKILLLLRNPYSVCHSLIYNFQLLEIVYGYRKNTMIEADFVDNTITTELKMSLEIYRHSIRNALEIISSFNSSRIQVIIYDDAILDLKTTLTKIANFMDTELPQENFIPRSNTDYTTKWRNLSQEYIDLIQHHAVPLWNQVLDLAAIPS